MPSGWDVFLYSLAAIGFSLALLVVVFVGMLVRDIVKGDDT